MNFLSSVFGFFKSFQFWVTVAPWEMGLRIRLGKTAAIMGPGPHLRIPFLDRMFVQTVRTRTISDNGQTVSASDGKALTINISVMYQINDILKLHMNVSTPESALLSLIHGEIAKIISSRVSSDVTLNLLETLAVKDLPVENWGLCDIKLIVTTFAITKVIRLLNYEYQTTSQTNNLSSTTDVV